MHSFRDRVVVVTGAARGIGRGVARRFAREGATVVVADVDREAGQATADTLAALGGAGLYTHYDLFDEGAAGQLLSFTQEQAGGLDVLVNNAYPTTFSRARPMEERSLEKYEAIIRSGYLAVVALMNAAMPVMRERGGGRIINMCSLNGVNAHKYTADYNAAKEALRAYSRTAAVEWMRHGITTNVICPAALSEAARAYLEKQPDMMAEMLSQNPAGRMGDAEQDIGGAALLLASDDAGYINGNTLFVDGGSHVNGVNWSPTV